MNKHPSTLYYYCLLFIVYCLLEELNCLWILKNLFCCAPEDNDDDIMTTNPISTASSSVAANSHGTPQIDLNSNQRDKIDKVWTSGRKKQKNVLDPSGLSVVERVFFKSAPSKPQVIMCIMLRCRLPPTVPKLKLERIIDLLKIAQSKHYRLASYVDPETMIVHPFADNAKDLPLNYRFIERTSIDTCFDVYKDEINTNFDVDDPSKPLWRVAIVLSPKSMPNASDQVFKEVINHLLYLEIPHVYTL